MNIPWDTSPYNILNSGVRISDDEYYYAFEMLIMPMLKDYQPDVIFISSGFDAAEGDPLGSLNLTPIGYSYMTRRLMSLNKKIIYCLEGGYNLNSLERMSEAIIKTLLGYEKPFKGLIHHNNLMKEKEINDNLTLNDIIENASSYFCRSNSVFNMLNSIREEFSCHWKCLKEKFEVKSFNEIHFYNYLKVNSHEEYKTFVSTFKNYIDPELIKLKISSYENKHSKNINLEKKDQNLQQEEYLDEFFELNFGLFDGKENPYDKKFSYSKCNKAKFLKNLNKNIRTTQYANQFHIKTVFHVKFNSLNQISKGSLDHFVPSYELSEDNFCINDLKILFDSKENYINSLINEIVNLKKLILSKKLNFFGLALFVFFKSSNEECKVVISQVTELEIDNSDQIVKSLENFEEILNKILKNEDIIEETSSKGDCVIF